MDSSNLVGTRLNKYEIHAEIGRGGMGAVYKGYDPTLDRYVAVKVLAPHLVWEKESVQRFVREARPELPMEVEAVLTKALAKEPGDRYAMASAFVDALGRALAGEEVVEAPTLVPEPSAPAPASVI